MGDLTKTEPHLEQALPGHRKLLVDLGELFKQLGKLVQAKKT